METIPELELINKAAGLGQQIKFTEEDIADIDKMIQQEDYYEISLSVYRKGNTESGDFAPDDITRADLLPVLKTVRDRNVDKLKQLHAELKEIILKLKK